MEKQLLKVICVKKSICLGWNLFNKASFAAVSAARSAHYCRLQATNQEPCYGSGKIGSQGNTLRYSLIVSKTSFYFSVEVSLYLIQPKWQWCHYCRRVLIGRALSLPNLSFPFLRIQTTQPTSSPTSAFHNPLFPFFPYLSVPLPRPPSHAVPNCTQKSV